MSQRPRRNAISNGSGGAASPSNPAKRQRVTSPARTPADKTAEVLENIVATFDKQKEVAVMSSEELKDLVELLQRSVRKEVSEAKRLPEAHEAKVR